MAVVAGGGVRTGDPAVLLADRSVLADARLGPAWAPSVHRLLDRIQPANGDGSRRPRTAAELSDLVG